MPGEPLPDRIAPGGSIRVTPEDAPVIPTLVYAFAPLHKGAFGIGVGAAGAFLLCLLTIGGLVLPRGGEFPLHLLDEYFAGYTVSWPGVVIAAGWGFGVGFVAGFFVAFCRNLALAITAFYIRTRAELVATREFLDHI